MDFSFIFWEGLTTLERGSFFFFGVLFPTQGDDIVVAWSFLWKFSIAFCYPKNGNGVTMIGCLGDFYQKPQKTDFSKGLEFVATGFDWSFLGLKVFGDFQLVEETQILDHAIFQASNLLAG